MVMVRAVEATVHVEDVQPGIIEVVVVDVTPLLT
jgi:hypothetical protein